MRGDSFRLWETQVSAADEGLSKQRTLGAQGTAERFNWGLIFAAS
jgi:hypothetical protein